MRRPRQDQLRTFALPEGRAALRAYRTEQARIAGLPAPERQPALEALNRGQRELVQTLAAGELLRMANAPAGRGALEAALPWFWFNHFNVFASKAGVGAALPSYLQDAIRPHVRGSFRELLLAVTTHPAMLLYLDNARNAAGRINENHARELLELHTLGVDGGYGQHDVREVARVLTGLGVRPRAAARRSHTSDAPTRDDDDAFFFDPRRHDDGRKSVLGHKLAGDGLAEVLELVNLLAAQPATARHLARRLASFVLGDPPPATAVEDAQRTYLDSGGHLGRMTDTLAVHARSGAVVPTLKDPMRWVLDSLRLMAVGRTLKDAHPPMGWLIRLGQPMFGRSTPDGYPLQGREWTSAGQLAQRVELARSMAFQQRRIFDTPRHPHQVLDGPTAQQLIRRLGAESRRALAQTAEAGDRLALLLVSPEFIIRDPELETA